jgi:hypothetical protein
MASEAFGSQLELCGESLQMELILQTSRAEKLIEKPGSSQP